MRASDVGGLLSCVHGICTQMHQKTDRCARPPPSITLNSMEARGMHTVEPSAIATAVVQPEGFAPSARVAIPTPGGPDAPVALRLTNQPRGPSTTSCCLSHALHVDPAADHVLVLTAPLWVFNCTAVPIALRPARGGPEEGAEEGPVDRYPSSTSEQHHPWLLPYGGMGWAPFAAAGGHRGPHGAPGLEELVEAIVAGTVVGGGGRTGRMGGVAGRGGRLASFRSDALLTRSLEQHVCRCVCVQCVVRKRKTLRMMVLFVVVVGDDDAVPGYTPTCTHNTHTQACSGAGFYPTGPLGPSHCGGACGHQQRARAPRVGPLVGCM